MSVLTVYLSEDGKDAPSSAKLSTLFHSLIHDKLNKEEKKIFRSDIEKIDRYLREIYDSRGKRSVVFFSAGDNLWEVNEFEFPLPSLCLVGSRPHREDLRRAVLTHQRYLVLLVDREKARLFTVYLGKIEEYKGFIDVMVPRIVKAKKVEYGREDKILRHIEDHLRHHLDLVAIATDNFVKGSFAQNKQIHFILLGGHKKLFSKIKQSLPYPLSKMVRGQFVTELNIPINDIFQKSKQSLTLRDKDTLTLRDKQIAQKLT